MRPSRKKKDDGVFYHIILFLTTTDRAYQYLAQGWWFRVNSSGTVHLGTYEYRFGYRYRGQTMEITFDPVHVAFVC